MKNIAACLLIFSVVILTPLYAQAAKGRQAHRIGMGVCPVSNGESSGKYSYIYADKEYTFCCYKCMEEFKKNPQQYLARYKEVKVEAHRYAYTPDTIKVKKGDIVRLEVSALDATHGLYIKEYGIKLQVPQGESREVEFIADKVGSFDMACTVYCGPGHSDMRGKFIVEE